MNAPAVVTTPEEQRALEAFYAYEARLLDNRCYQDWLALVDPQIQYLVPARVNVPIDNRLRGQQQMLAIDNELEQASGDGCPLREENYLILSLRVERAYKINSWSENPPARTRRIVGNVELLAREGNRHETVSNFHLYYARPAAQSVLYSGQRRDVLLLEDDSFTLARREVVLDYAEIEAPTIGLLF